MNDYKKWFPILILLPLLLGIPFIRYNYPLFLPATSSRALIGSLELIFSLYVFLFVARAGFPTIKRSSRYLLSLWVLATVLATWQAAHLFPALVRQAEWYAHILFGIALWHYLNRYPASTRLLFLLIPAGFFIAGLLVLLEWHVVLPNPSEAPWMMGIPGFRHIRHFAYYILIALIFGSFFLADGKSSRATFLSAALFLSFCWGFLFWSGSRGAILAMLGSSSVIFWLMRSAPNRQKFFSYFTASALFGFLLSLFYQVTDSGLGLFRFFSVQKASSLNQISSGRLSIWGKTLETYLESPWLGLGPDGYAYIQPSPLAGTIQPHNMWIQLLVEWGLIGAALSALLLGLGLWQIYRKMRQERAADLNIARMISLWGLIAYLVLGLTDGTFYHPFALLFVALCFAIGLQPGDRLQEDFTKIHRLLWSGGASLLLGILLLHGSVVSSLSSGIPGPESFQARLLRSFPSSVEGLEYTSLPRWRKKYPEAALNWTRWAQLHARDRLPFLLLETNLLLEKGQKREAADCFARSLALAPARKRPKLEQIYSARFSDLPKPVSDFPMR